ncbi:unnamed protein product [Heterobilharzia americana]|nr:unnamed protein product [Heterobilharzia americana]CAH8462546.1 unnamed protein product [Heterobilharzia americana]
MDAEVEVEEDFSVPQITPKMNFNYSLIALFVFVISYFMWKFFRSRNAHSVTRPSAGDEAHRKAMEAARAKLQAEFDAEIARYKSKKQDEEEARKQAKNLTKFMINGTTTEGDEKKKKKLLRSDDYNPLTGDTGTTYRPTSRFCSRGG